MQLRWLLLIVQKWHLIWECVKQKYMFQVREMDGNRQFVQFMQVALKWQKLLTLPRCHIMVVGLLNVEECKNLIV